MEELGRDRDRWDRQGRLAWLLPVLTFGVGVFVGWLVLGGWLLPLRTTEPSPAELAPAAQTEWVRMVSDLYQREFGRDDRLQRAQARLESFTAEELALGLGRVAGGEDPVDAQNARLLSADLGVIPLPADLAAADTGRPAAAADEGAGFGAGGLAQAARTLAVAVLVAAVAAAGSLLWAWNRWRRQQAPRRSAPARGLGETGGSEPAFRRETTVALGGAQAVADGEAADDAADEAGAPVDASDPVPPVQAQARSRRRGGFSPLPRPEGSTETLELPRRLGGSGSGAPAWRPARVDLGDSARVEYDGTDDRFFQTWLVYDERAGLVGSAGLKAQPVGSINTLDLWFFERDEEGEPHERPMVTLVARPALGEPVLRARLRDRELLPAEVGARTTLHAGDLALEVMIEAVEPDPQGEELALRHVRLRLTPRRGEHDDDTAATDEPDPPLPLPFRRER